MSVVGRLLGGASERSIVMHPLARPRLDALVGLRGLGAVAVIIAHYVYRAPQLYPELGIKFHWAEPSRYVVNLFFMASGFVIFLTLQRRTTRRFAIARIIRLYPAYWISIAITFTIVTLVGLHGRQVTLAEAALNLTMAQTYLGVPRVDGAYWTLAVEFLFYVQCGLLLSAGLANNDRALAIVLPVWLGISALTAVPGIDSANVLVSAIWWATRFTPYFMIGVGLYFRWLGEKRPSKLVLIPLSIAVLTLHSPIEAAFAALFLLVLWVAIWGPDIGLRMPLLMWLGVISYALYLLHQNIGFVVMLQITPFVGQRFAIPLAMLVVVAIAAAVTFLFDIPVRRVLTRWARPRRVPR